MSQVCCGKGGNCDNFPVWTSTPKPKIETPDNYPSGSGCSNEDGLGVSAAYPCACGDATCNEGEICDRMSNRCLAPSPDQASGECGRFSAANCPVPRCERSQGAC